jgi:hypothetical protein
MRVRHWRPLLAAAVAVTAVAAGVVVATTPAAALSDGTRARIMAKSNAGERFYLMPTGELRPELRSVDRYTFVATSCGEGKSGVCYEIQAQIGDKVQCLFYWAAFDPRKIQYGACGTTSLQHRWHIDSLKGGGVRLRPASHGGRCVVYDPAIVADYRYTSIVPCTRPLSHTRFWLTKA